MEVKFYEDYYLEDISSVGSIGSGGFISSIEDTKKKNPIGFIWEEEKEESLILL